MSEKAVHPTHQMLSAYNLGQLSPEETEEIERHINECEPCCDTIVGLTNEDTFVDLLRSAKQLPVDQTPKQGVVTSPSKPFDAHPRYEVIELIGKGGMGDVYKARHRVMDRTVALKFIRPELIRKQEAVDRFQREVKAAAKLSHPNIVTAYDAERAEDVHFLVMEYVDGVDLSQVVEDRGMIPIDEACALIEQAAIGLQHAHEQGMVHRDIKPHNLMVLEDGTVKILDFGLACLAPEATTDGDPGESRGDLTSVGTVMGTPDFISPEQAADARQADIRSDIYSLGASLYILLCGRPLFAEGSVKHKLKSHAIAEPEPLQSLRQDVPKDLVSAVKRMTAKDPQERFQTPGEVADALASFSKRTSEKTPIRPSLQTKPSRIRPQLLLLTAIAALFLGIVLASTVFFMKTNYGMVRVEVLDPSLTVQFNAQVIRVDDGEKEFTINAGEQKKLIVTIDDSSSKLTTKDFEISRGDKIAFKIERINGEVIVRKDGDAFDRVPLDSDSIAAQESIQNAARFLGTVSSYSDHERLQGFWIATSRVVDGVTVQRNWERDSLTTQFFGHGIDWDIGGDEDLGDGSYRLDPSQTPKHIDIRGEDGDITQGIYELDDESLRLCISNVIGSTRPSSFESTADSKTTITTLTLIDAPVESNRSYMRGTWRVTSRVIAGVASSDRELRKNPFTYTFGKNDLLTNVGDSQTKGSYRFVDYFGDPKTVNLIDADGNITRSICEFNGRTMTLCLQDPDSNQRPDSFESTANSRTTVLTLQRVAPPVSDFQLIQGNWALIPSASELAGKVSWTFLGSKLLKNDGTEKLNTSFLLNPYEKQIELIDENWTITLGKYEFREDRLQVQLTGAIHPRSSTNPNNAESNPCVLTFRRVETQADVQQLQGSWQVLHVEGDGEMVPFAGLKGMRFIFDGNHVTIGYGRKGTKCSFSLPPSKSPSSIDITIEGVVSKGIYERNGNLLRLTLGHDTRPSGFDAKGVNVMFQMRRIPEDELRNKRKNRSSDQLVQ
ncbi:MAG: TIGR03067 domain-containing protein [Planctomycetota bacterium]